MSKRPALGIGKTTVYRMARAYNYQTPKVQGKRLMTASLDTPFSVQTFTARLIVLIAVKSY